MAKDDTKIKTSDSFNEVTQVTGNDGIVILQVGSVAEVNLQAFNDPTLAGNYENPKITVDPFGRISAAKSHLIKAGTGINIASDLSSPNDSIVSLQDITPTVTGYFTSANITVDNQGRITSAASGSSTTAGVISVGSGITNTITVSGDTAKNPVIDLSKMTTTGATANYPTRIIYDDYGRVEGVVEGVAPLTDISSTSLSIDNTTAAKPVVNLKTPSIAVEGDYTFANISVDKYGMVSKAASGTLTEGAAISIAQGASPTISLKDTAVSAGTYTNSNLTIDAQGRVTAASNGTDNITNVTSGTTNTIIVSGTAANPILDLKTNGITAKSYAYPASITCDGFGRTSSITEGVAPNLDAKYIIAASDSTLPNAQNISSLTGLVKSTAGVLSTANAGTDYIAGVAAGTNVNLTGTAQNPTINLNSTLTGSTWGGSTIDVSHGGTGQTTLTNNSLLIGAGNTSVAFVAPASTGTVLTGMSGAAPVFSATPIVDKITINNNPETSTDGVNKAYADAIAAGITFKVACTAATLTNLNAVYDNGTSGVNATLTAQTPLAALVVDGVTLSAQDRVLVKNQTTPTQNGIYTLTTLGTSSVPWVLTRASDYDTTTEIRGGSVVVINEGTQQGQSSWIQTVKSVAVGTSSILFSPFTYSPAAYLQVGNNLSDLNNVVAARTNLNLTNVAIQSTTVGNVLVGGAANSIVSQPLTNGQLLIGSTTGAPVASAPTDSTNIVWTKGSGTLSANLSNAIVTPGSLATTSALSSGSSITAATSITATNGNITASTGNINTVNGSITAGGTNGSITAAKGLTISSGNITAASSALSIASITIGTQTPAVTTIVSNLTASTGIALSGNTTGNVTVSTSRGGIYINSTSIVGSNNRLDQIFAKIGGVTIPPDGTRVKYTLVGAGAAGKVAGPSGYVGGGGGAGATCIWWAPLYSTDTVVLQLGGTSTGLTVTQPPLPVTLYTSSFNPYTVTCNAGTTNTLDNLGGLGGDVSVSGLTNYIPIFGGNGGAGSQYTSANNKTSSGMGGNSFLGGAGGSITDFGGSYSPAAASILNAKLYSGSGGGGSVYTLNSSLAGNGASGCLIIEW